ncbi:MAG: hypothetical protein KDC85_12300 [Saprospiraceae bacterium]|nr:hypothetical protein [Saprospiraceae bacterium]MCB9324453.1 hypothetical protein [Lewinellaceae bacterium]
MRAFKFTALLCCFLLFSCQNSPNKQSDKGPELKNLNWLPGSWERINDEAGKHTFEIWEKETEQIYRGVGYTLMEEDTIFKEYLRILFKDGKVNYEVSGVNDSPTDFKFIGQSEYAFACENLENEFPNRIEYIYQNDTIFSTIMGGTNSIVFVFVRH